MGEDQIFLDLCAGNKLQWAPQLGIGFLPGVDNKIYDADYMEKYVQYETTAMGQALTAFRLSFVQRFLGKWDGLVDVGIGSGQFISACTAARIPVKGTDINPFAIAQLRVDNRMWKVGDPFWPAALTFWDSLEHIPDPSELIGDAQKWIFVSAPVYKNMEHALISKHYRPGEHCWYWTHAGLLNFMEHFGFAMVACDFTEQVLGREDINTYAFKRIG